MRAQIPVGLGTPSQVVEAVTRQVDEHLKSNKMEFTGNRDIVFKEITETMPIRMLILVAVQMSHTGKGFSFLALYCFCKLVLPEAKCVCRQAAVKCCQNTTP